MSRQPTAPMTANAPAQLTTSGSSQVVVAANSNRSGLVLVNTDGTDSISIGFGAAAVSGSGLTLKPGQTYVMDEYTFNKTTVYAIASANTPNLSIQEFQQ